LSLLDKLPNFVRNHKFMLVIGELLGSDDGDFEDVVQEQVLVRVHEDDLDKAQLITSENVYGLHRPLIDIDFGAELIPSSTPGHYHLYLEKDMIWEQYEKLLIVLEEVGIIGKGVLTAAQYRKFTSLRLPWVKK